MHCLQPHHLELLVPLFRASERCPKILQALESHAEGPAAALIPTRRHKLVAPLILTPPSWRINKLPSQHLYLLRTATKVFLYVWTCKKRQINQINLSKSFFFFYPPIVPHLHLLVTASPRRGTVFMWFTIIRSKVDQCYCTSKEW